MPPDDPVKQRPPTEPVQGEFLLRGKRLTITDRAQTITARFKERVVIEDCEIDLRFPAKHFGNVGIFIFACKDVTLRNVRVRGLTDGAEASGGIRIFDADQTLIEDCSIQGSFDRENLELRDCGPATIRRVESRGRRVGDGYRSGSGIWVANGRGESKLLPANPDRPRYPSRGLRIEDCVVADCTGTANKDGIYIQSIRDFIVRRCRVENWRHDGLVDVGFRDTKGDRPNHGGTGRFEDCDFHAGYLKVTVGAAGGITFRNCRSRGVSYVPYFFDGGTVYFEKCVFDGFADAAWVGNPNAFAVNQQGDWLPDPQDTYGRSSVTRFNDCDFRDRELREAFLLGNPKHPFVRFFAGDRNTYDLPNLKVFARDVTGVIPSFAEWRRRTGNDRNSRWKSER